MANSFEPNITSISFYRELAIPNRGKLKMDHRDHSTLKYNPTPMQFDWNVL